MNKKLRKIIASFFFLTNTHTHAFDINIVTGELYAGTQAPKIDLITGNMAYPHLFQEQLPLAIEPEVFPECTRKPRCTITAQIGFRTDSIHTISSGNCNPLFLNTHIKTCAQEKNMYALPIAGTITAYSKHFMVCAQGEYAPILGAAHPGENTNWTNGYLEETDLDNPSGHFADALLAVGPYFKFGPQTRSEISPQFGLTYDQQYIKHSCLVPQKTIHNWLGPALGLRIATHRDCWSLGASYYFTFARYQRNFRKCEERYCFTSNNAYGGRLSIDGTIKCTRNVDAALSLIAYAYEAHNGNGKLHSDTFAFHNLFKHACARWASLQVLAGITYNF